MTNPAGSQRDLDNLDQALQLRLTVLQAQLQAQAELTGQRFDSLRELVAETSAAADAASAHRYSLMMERFIAVKAEMVKGVEDAKETLYAHMQGEVNLTAEKFAAAGMARESRCDRIQSELQGEINLTAERFTAIEKAVERAQAASDRRFEAVNEFRAQLGDIIGTMMPRAETTALIKSIEDRLADVKSITDKGFTGVDVRHVQGAESRLEYRDTRADFRSNLAIMVAVASVILTALVAFITQH